MSDHDETLMFMYFEEKINKMVQVLRQKSPQIATNVNSMFTIDHVHN